MYLKPELSSNHGKTDLIIDSEQLVYVLELKVVELEGDGLKANTRSGQGPSQAACPAWSGGCLNRHGFFKAESNLAGFEYEHVEEEKL